jgi:hypothetical protein
MPMPRSRLIAVLGAALVVALVVAAGLVWWVSSRGGEYDHALQRYDDSRGEPNRYVDLPDGEAQLAYGSPDRHRLVVQWRDPEGHGWTAPETLFESRSLTAVDSTIRYADGTVAIVQTFTPDTSKDSDIGDEVVVMICRDRTCTPGETGRGYSSSEPQLSKDGDTVYLGETARDALVWTREDGFSSWPWSGLPGRAELEQPLLAPDGSLRLVTGTPGRGECTFTLHASGPRDAALETVAQTTEPLRGRAPSDCRSYLDTFSADWVSTHPDDHRAADFWFVRDGDTWSTTRDDPSGLVSVDRPRDACCGLAVAGFIHWNDLAFGSPDGHRISVQSHFQGEESWEPRQLLDGAPAGYRCTWIDGHEVDDGFAVLLTCHSPADRSDDQFRGDAYALAVTTDLRHWESTFVTDVRRDPVIDDEGVTIVGKPRTHWSPESGFERDQGTAPCPGAPATQAFASDLAALSATRRDSVPPSHLRLARYGAKPRSRRRRIRSRTLARDVHLPQRLGDGPDGALAGAQVQDDAGHQGDDLAVLELHGGPAGEHQADLLDLGVLDGAGLHLPHPEVGAAEAGEDQGVLGAEVGLQHVGGQHAARACSSHESNPRPTASRVFRNRLRRPSR